MRIKNIDATQLKSTSSFAMFALKFIYIKQAKEITNNEISICDVYLNANFLIFNFGASVFKPSVDIENTDKVKHVFFTSSALLVLKLLQCAINSIVLIKLLNSFILIYLNFICFHSLQLINIRSVILSKPINTCLLAAQYRLLIYCNI